MAIELQELAYQGDIEEPVRRRRRVTPLRVALAGAVGLAAAFVAVYLLFFTPDSPPALTLSTAPQATGAPAGVWSVGTGSVAGYRVREQLVRLPAPNDAVGRTSAITGRFELAQDRDAVVVKAGMRIEVDLSTLKSDEDRRDDHMHTMAVETNRFPTATFVSTSDLVVRPDGGSAAQMMAHGDLTLHGVTRTVDIPVQAGYDGTRVEVVGSLSFPWELFEMERPNLSYVTVEADPTMEFQLFFDHIAP